MWRDDAMLDRQDNSVSSIAGPKLSPQVEKVRVHRCSREKESAGYLGVGTACGEMSENIHFAFGKGKWGCASNSGPCDHRGNHLTREIAPWGDQRIDRAAELRRINWERNDRAGTFIQEIGAR